MCFLFIIFASLCRWRLEYASTVSNSLRKTECAILELVQRNMACVLYYRHIGDANHSYTVVAGRFHLFSLSNRWCMAYIMFLFKCLRGRTETPDPLARLSPRSPRYNQALKSTFYPYALNILHILSRLQTSHNTLANKVDISNSDFRLFGESKLSVILRPCETTRPYSNESDAVDCVLRIFLIIVIGANSGVSLECFRIFVHFVRSYACYCQKYLYAVYFVRFANVWQHKGIGTFLDTD